MIPYGSTKNYSIREIEYYLVLHRANCTEGAAHRYFPFYQAKRVDMLSEYQREYAWSVFHNIVHQAEALNFKLKGSKQVAFFGGRNAHYVDEYHEARVLMFVEWLQCFPFPKFHSPSQIIFRYRKCFFHLEAIYQFERLGIALSEETQTLPLVRQVDSKEIKFAVSYWAYTRSNYYKSNDVEGFYKEYYKRDSPTLRRLYLLARQVERMRGLVESSCGNKQHKFIQTLWVQSLEELAELDNAESVFS